MKATYRNKDGTWGSMDHPVIKPQAATHSDAFTLLAFASWEDVDKETLAAAATDVLEFHLIEDKQEMGFHGHKK